MSIDLTIKEALSDPLIGLMLEADGLNPQAFADLLDQAAEEQLQQRMLQLRQNRADEFYRRLSDTQAEEQSCGHC